MAATPNGSHSYPKRVVLCVDDEAQILQVLHEFMTASGYSVLTARTP